MEKSLDLLDRAVAGGHSERELSRFLGMKSSTLGVARHRGNLSPIAAGRLAAYLGLDPALWTAIAAFESDAAQPQNRALLERMRERAREITPLQPVQPPGPTPDGTVKRWRKR